MAFHVACPITCKRICFCTLGFPTKLQAPGARNAFLAEVLRVEAFLKDPFGVRAKKEETVQVSVPKLSKHTCATSAAVTGDGEREEAAAAMSAQTKRIALQRNAAVASMVAEDFARRFESGDPADVPRDTSAVEQGQHNVNVMCRMCFYGENEGSERAKRMLSCKSCGKKYHRSCIKSWSQQRDLFHWSSWTCPSCRICEVCRRTGDPNKLMFCKRCDDAYHCYCQHPPHKNVSTGPYLCPKHTRCHSCGSTVPGNGLSVRWFHGYTCCDACGRLFMKGNYCPVCLKVYRDSESTPMVCCDVCQRWVHCQCDGISDEKYLQFQVDGNLQYVCAPCRGDCYQVKDLEDAIQELWRKRDEADRDLTANLRAAAGLPTQEELFSVSPYSDDEDNGPLISKNEFGRSLKFSLKGLIDKSPKKTKEYAKKFSNKKDVKKKGYQTSLIVKTESNTGLEGHDDAGSFGFSLADEMTDNLSSGKTEVPDVSSTYVARRLSLAEGDQSSVIKPKFVNEVTTAKLDRDPGNMRTRDTKLQVVNAGEDTVRAASKSKTMKGTKLVIHLGARNKSLTNSPRSDASSCQKEQGVSTSNGSEGTSQHILNVKGDRHESTAKLRDDRGDFGDHFDQPKGSWREGREGKLEKIVRSEISEINPKFRERSCAEEYEYNFLGREHILPYKRDSDEIGLVGHVTEGPRSGGDKVYSRMHSEGGRNDIFLESNLNNCRTPFARSLPKGTKPSLKLKFKNPYLENQSSWVPRSEEEKSSIKGQRSKRKRPTSFIEKTSLRDDHDASVLEEQDNLMDEMDANWILVKLGKDAVGKRVEVHQLPDNTWHKGIVSDVLEGTSVLSVDLDHGGTRALELRKQRVRFISQKHKRSRT